MSEPICTLKNPKLCVETDAKVGVEVHSLPGFRMMHPATADFLGLEGETMRCNLCPYGANCPRFRE